MSPLSYRLGPKLAERHAGDLMTVEANGLDLRVDSSGAKRWILRHNGAGRAPGHWTGLMLPGFARGCASEGTEATEDRPLWG